MRYQAAVGREAHPPLIHAAEKQQHGLDVRNNRPDGAGQPCHSALPTTAPPECTGQREANGRVAGVSAQVTVIMMWQRVQRGMRGDARQQGRGNGPAPTPYGEPGGDVDPARRQEASNRSLTVRGARFTGIRRGSPITPSRDMRTRLARSHTCPTFDRLPVGYRTRTRTRRLPGLTRQAEVIHEASRTAYAATGAISAMSTRSRRARIDA